MSKKSDAISTSGCLPIAFFLFVAGNVIWSLITVLIINNLPPDPAVKHTLKLQYSKLAPEYFKEQTSCPNLKDIRVKNHKGETVGYLPSLKGEEQPVQEKEKITSCLYEFKIELPESSIYAISSSGGLNDIGAFTLHFMRTSGWEVSSRAIVNSVSSDDSPRIRYF